jgi:predicted metal-dependent phosphoesterase TrpH
VKVELHAHTSKYSVCSRLTPEELVSGVIDAGYGAVYLTEHDIMWSEDELVELQAKFPAIRIFPGVELTLERCHLLVLGTMDPAFLELSDAAEIIRMAREAGCATILAHPLRWHGGAALLESGELPDALECGTPNHDLAKRERAIAMCEELGMSPIFADDLHRAEITGSYWIETDEPLVGPLDIREVLLSGSYTCGASEKPAGF